MINQVCPEDRGSIERALLRKLAQQLATSITVHPGNVDGARAPVKAELRGVWYAIEELARQSDWLDEYQVFRREIVSQARQFRGELPYERIVAGIK